MSSMQLKLWMRHASTDEQEELAVNAGTSRQMLYSLSAIPTSTAHRKASNDLAARIEEAAQPIIKNAEGRLPSLNRGDLNYTCAVCPYFKACKVK